MAVKNTGWFRGNWHEIVDKSARYSGILALIVFICSLVLFWAFEYETINGIKASVIIWLFSQVIGALRGLK
jgi:hypothetical protein